jgi:hypothetical protein
MSDFERNFETDFPVSVSVRWDTPAGVPAEARDADTIRAVFEAMRDMRVYDIGHAYEGAALVYTFTMADGTSYSYAFAEGYYFQEGNKETGVVCVTGFERLAQALPFEAPEPTISPQETEQQAIEEQLLEEQALRKERLQRIQPILYPGSVVNDFFDDSSDDFRYISDADFSEVAAWYARCLPELFGGYEAETDEGWRRYSGTFEGFSLIVTLIDRASGEQNETNISILFFGV